MNNSATLTSITTFILLFVGCAVQQNIPTTVVSPPVYQYAPPANAEARSAKIVLSFLNPVYGNQLFQDDSRRWIGQFMEKFPNDFEELLLAKGLSIRGPFTNYDDITYADKSESHLLILPVFDIRVDESGAQYETKQKYSYPSGYSTVGRCIGTLKLRCTMTIEARESLTRELIWKKTVDLAEIPAPIESEKFYSDYNRYKCYQHTDAGVANPYARGLEQLYVSALDKCWDLLDTRELDGLMPGVEEIREKKVH